MLTITGREGDGDADFVMDDRIEVADADDDDDGEFVRIQRHDGWQNNISH